MATLAETNNAAAPAASAARDERFFLTTAILMALVLVAGFTLNVVMGRSTFASPLPVHVHALVFFGWTTLYVTQNVLVHRAQIAIHRRLGRLAGLLIPLMVIVGTYLTIRMVQAGRVPFFFQPAYFLVMNPLTVFAFAGLAVAAVVQRRRTAWHRRLMFCAMAMLLGPGFGRLLPGPLLMPWAPSAIFAAIMLFPLAGVVADLRRSGRVHPAWIWGIGTMLAVQCAIGLIARSPVGVALYTHVVAGTPGAAFPALDYPPPPPA